MTCQPQTKDRDEEMMSMHKDRDKKNTLNYGEPGKVIKKEKSIYMIIHD